MKPALFPLPHAPGDILIHRYTLIAMAGQGTFGTTYVARDRTTKQRVAIKVLSLKQMSDWKVLELFQREAKVLAHLDHPNIPNYLGHFSLDTTDDRRFYLVQQFIEGESCYGWVQRLGCPSANQIQDIAVQVLDILNYIHRLSPPIIHRDIKPTNLIRRSDGQIFLVDCGAVQDVYRNTLTHSGTFVGTLGYMPMEQLQGRVQLASDLYSLGATLVFLLTGKSPCDLPQSWVKLQFRPYIGASTAVSPEFLEWLDQLIEPAIEDRFSSAQDALQELHNQTNWPQMPLRRQTPCIHWKKNRSRFRLELQPKSFPRPSQPAVKNSTFILMLVLFLLLGPYLFIIICLSYAVLYGYERLRFPSYHQSALEIDRDTFTIQVSGWPRSHYQGKTANISLFSASAKSSQHRRSTKFILWEGTRQHILWADHYSATDVREIVQLVNDFVHQHQT